MAQKQTLLDIAYIKTEYHTLEELHEFQGSLKELWKDNAERLWRQMVETGFSDPFKVWHDGERLHLLDGHQRRRVLMAKRKEKIGVKIPDKFPCDYIRCKDRQEAKIRVLQFVSQYGKVTDEGLYEFMIENELDPELLKMDFDIPNLNMDEFLAGYFEGDGENDGGGGEGEGGNFKPAIIKDADMEALKPTDEEHAILKDKKFLVEFSGGKDSSLATLWIRQFYPEAEIQLMFVDGGADFVGYDLHLDTFARYLGVELQYLRAKENIIDAFIKRGKWPKAIGPYCQGNIIFARFDDYVQNYNDKDVIIIRGGSVRQKNTHIKGKSDRFMSINRAPIKNHIYFQPLYFLDDKLTLPMLQNMGCPLWEGYFFGLQRTACRVCPGQKAQAYSAIKINYPDVWQELMYLQNKLGPGCWTDPRNQMKGTFEELAEKGMEKFLAGGYKRKSPGQP